MCARIKSQIFVFPLDLFALENSRIWAIKNKDLIMGLLKSESENGGILTVVDCAIKWYN